MVAVRQPAAVHLFDEFDLEELALHARDKAEQLAGVHPADCVGKGFVRCEPWISQPEGILDLGRNAGRVAHHVAERDAANEQEVKKLGLAAGPLRILDLLHPQVAAPCVEHAKPLELAAHFLNARLREGRRVDCVGGHLGAAAHDATDGATHTG